MLASMTAASAGGTTEQRMRWPGPRSRRAASGRRAGRGQGDTLAVWVAQRRVPLSPERVPWLEVAVEAGGDHGRIRGVDLRGIGTLERQRCTRGTGGRRCPLRIERLDRRFGIDEEPEAS